MQPSTLRVLSRIVSGCLFVGALCFLAALPRGASRSASQGSRISASERSSSNEAEADIASQSANRNPQGSEAPGKAGKLTESEQLLLKSCLERVRAAFQEIERSNAKTIQTFDTDKVSGVVVVLTEPSKAQFEEANSFLSSELGKMKVSANLERTARERFQQMTSSFFNYQKGKYKVLIPLVYSGGKASTFVSGSSNDDTVLSPQGPAEGGAPSINYNFTFVESADRWEAKNPLYQRFSYLFQIEDKPAR